MKPILNCERCHHPLNGQSVKMSFFNTDMCCPDCLKQEATHPAYAQAKQAEHDAVCRGDYNFPGIGKPSDL